MKIKLNIEAYGSAKGSTIEVSQQIGEQMVRDGDAVEVTAKGRKKVSNKAMSAKE